MRNSHGSGGSNLDQQLQKPLPGQKPEAKGDSSLNTTGDGPAISHFALER